MSKYAILILMLLCSFSRPNYGCLKIDIMLVGDYSTSVQKYESQCYNAFKSFVQNFDTSDDGIKIGLIRFADSATMISKLTGDKQELLQSLKMFETKAVGSTDMLSAVDIATDEFLSNSRPDRMKLMIIVSDGEVGATRKRILERSKIFKDFLKGKICTIMIQKEKGSDIPYNHDSTFWGMYSIRPKYEYDDVEFMKNLSNDCYIESDYKNLETELKKLDICL